MTDLNPIYLIGGTDRSKIADARRRLRERAEAEGGSSAFELLDSGRTTPGDVAHALSSMSLVPGVRYILATGVERWKSKDLGPLLSAMDPPPPDTSLVLVATGKAPTRLAEAVVAAGGSVLNYEAPKPWKMAAWARERGAALGLDLDSRVTAELVEKTAGNQLRIDQELRKLSTYAITGETGTEEMLEMVSGRPQTRIYALADAIAAGDAAGAHVAAGALLDQGESAQAVVGTVVRHLRHVLRAAEAVAAGRADGEIARELGLPPYVARRIVEQAEHSDIGRLRSAIVQTAELDCALKGGSPLSGATLLTMYLIRIGAPSA